METTHAQVHAPVPRLRGVMHAWACPVSAVLGIALAAAAPTARMSAAMLVYTFGMSAIFGTSAMYHRIDWSPRARRRMRQLDHSVIFVGMACTYTALWLCALDGPFATGLLVACWVGSIIGVCLKFRFIDAHNALHGCSYSAFGMLGVLIIPQLANAVGTGIALSLLAGGLLYAIGSIAFILGWPNPAPRVIGHHEVFHAFTIAGTTVHIAAFAALMFA